MLNVLIYPPCELGEGPVWDQALQTLLWVDIIQGAIHQYRIHDAHHHIINTNDLVGAAVYTTSGGILAALKSGLTYFDINDASIRVIAHPEEHLSTNRYNDGKCDANGYFWIGSMALDESAPDGHLYRLDHEGKVINRISDVTISNGLAWSTCNTTMYYIDSPTRCVCAYDFDLKHGSVSNKRVVIQFSIEDGWPDGMTIDTKGMLWIAHWGGSQISQWNPHLGVKLRAIHLPVSRVTSCVFGGHDLDVLYITTARKGLSSKELADEPLAGAVFAVNGLDARGYGSHRFRMV